MANMKSANFYSENKTGKVVQFSSPVTVDSMGVFSFTIPDYLKDVAENSSSDFGDAVLDITRTGKYRVRSSSYDKCKTTVKNLVTTYLKCDVLRETIIIYKFSSKISYCKDINNKVHPNAVGIEGDHPNWKGNSSSGNKNYSIQLFAKIVDKITHKYGKEDKVEYAYTKVKLNENGKKLNSFIHLWMDFRDGPNEMPYTEKTAGFFYGLLLGMCSLDDKLESLFTSEESIISAIANRETPLKQLETA